MDLIFKEEFYLIKQACITVRKELGNGFLEKVYENALLIEFKRLGLSVVSQKELLVQYREQTIGQYFADIIVNDKIIIESLKDLGYQLIDYQYTQSAVERGSGTLNNKIGNFLRNIFFKVNKFFKNR